MQGHYLAHSRPQPKYGLRLLELILSSLVFLQLWSNSRSQFLKLVSKHANTAAGSDTQSVDEMSEPTFYSDGPASCFVYGLWVQPSTITPSIFLYSPTAVSSGRIMGILNAKDAYYVR